MAYSKVDLSFGISKEAAAHLSAITDTMNLTNEQAIEYLLELHDKVKPERNCSPKKCPFESHLHTCVRPEIKAKFRQLAREYGLSFGQLFSVLVDVYKQCPEYMASQTMWNSDMEAAKTGNTTETENTAEAKGAGNAMAELETALDMIRSAFLRMSSESEEVKTLREQLAQSQAETRKAKEAYQRKLQAIMEQLQGLT